MGACLWTTEQWLGALRGVLFLHGAIQHGLGLNVGASQLRRSQCNAAPRWLTLL